MQTTKLPPTLHHHNRFTERAAFVARTIAMISTITRTNNVIGQPLENHSRGSSGTIKNIARTITQIKLAGPNHFLGFISIGHILWVLDMPSYGLGS